MLSKFLFAILTSVLLTFASTGMADPGGGCLDSEGVCAHSGGGSGDGSNRNVKGLIGGGGDSCLVGEVDPGNRAIDLTEEETDWLLFMREEEKVARDSYLVLGDLWGLTIFGNIAVSEQAHMDALKNLIDCYGLEDPVIPGIGVFSNPLLQELFDNLMTEGAKSAMDGLYVGAAIEETDIVDIQDAIDITDNLDIVSTYESLMCGSRNHLRAFIRHIEINGESYIPSVLDEEVFWAIAYSDMERDCGVR